MIFAKTVRSNKRRLKKKSYADEALKAEEKTLQGSQEAFNAHVKLMNRLMFHHLPTLPHYVNAI